MATFLKKVLFQMPLFGICDVGGLI